MPDLKLMGRTWAVQTMDRLLMNSEMLVVVLTLQAIEGKAIDATIFRNNERNIPISHY